MIIFPPENISKAGFIRRTSVKLWDNLSWNITTAPSRDKLLLLDIFQIKSCKQNGWQIVVVWYVSDKYQKTKEFSFVRFTLRRMIINLAAPPYNALCSSYTNAVQRIIIMIVITSANTPFPPSGLIMFPLPKRDHHRHHHDFWPQSKVGSILRAVPLWQVLHSDGSLCTEYMLHWEQ